MRFPKTLRFRIVVASAAVSALIVIAAAIFVLQDARSRSLRALEARVGRELALLTAAPTDISALATSVNAAGAAVGGRLTLVAPDGRTIADSMLPVSAPASLVPLREILAARESGASGLQHRDPVLGGDALVRVATVGEGGAEAGFLRIAAPLSEVDDAIAGLRRSVAVGGVLTVVFATAFATLLAGRLTRSIGTVTSGARQVAAGDLEHRLRPEPPLEVEQLALAVNEMAAKLSLLIERESTERMRLSSVLSMMSEGVLVVDQDGVVDLANSAAMTMLDAPAAFQPGGRLLALNHNYELHELATAAAAGGEARQGRIELLDSRRVVQVIGLPLPARDSADSTSRALLLLSDLTEMRRVETTRREFISNASHELRTPIASISASVETLEAGAIDDPETARDFLRRIAEDTARMDGMVSELLELSRLQSGQAPFHLAPVDPAEAARRVADRFRPQAERVGVRLSVICDADLPLLTADEDKLDQVLSNLVANAVRATPSGGSIEIAVDATRRGVEFRVRDTGRGIEPEHLPHIFERFYKGDPARSEGGTGLGLAIARHIIEQHGGDIYVETVLGEGSTFVVSLPATSVEPARTDSGRTL